jgi:hypothetical protein
MLTRNEIIAQKYGNKFWEETNAGKYPNVSLLILDALHEATFMGFESPLTDAQLVEPWITDSDHRAVSYTDYECLAEFCRSLERRLKAVMNSSGASSGKSSPTKGTAVTPAVDTAKPPSETWNAAMERAAEIADYYAELMNSEAARRIAEQIRCTKLPLPSPGATGEIERSTFGDGKTYERVAVYHKGRVIKATPWKEVMNKDHTAQLAGKERDDGAVHPHRLI